MAKSKSSASNNRETDEAYFLKILMYIILGTIWLKLNDTPVLPLGMVVGLAFAHHDHFQIDRKIEYLCLLLATFAGYFGYGIFLTVLT